MNNIRSGGAETSRDMRESQRALELRKFFAPQPSNNTAVDTAFNDSLNNDGALDAYAETIVWRLRGVHAMVSLVDRGTQYFLAGAVRSGRSDTDEEVVTTGEWFGCQTVPTPGGLCENTLALDLTKEEYTCFIVNDLSKDERFANLPVVDGTIAAYRFYAGAPITTSRGFNIGSLFFFGDKARDGLPRDQRKFMHLQAANVMKHLETKREAAERRRVLLMSQGIARFLERTSQAIDIGSSDTPLQEDESNSENVLSEEEQHHEDTQDGIGHGRRKPSARDKESTMDKIRTTVNHATEILRESLELTSGGVVFLEPATSYIENDKTSAYHDPTTDFGAQVELSYQEEKGRQRSNESQLRPNGSQDGHKIGRHLSQGSIRSSTDKYQASKILAMSYGESATWDSSSKTLDAKTLQSFIQSYPQGNIWYLDDEGYFSSLEQISEWEQKSGISPSGRRRSISSMNLTQKKAEAAMLSRIFHGARQIIFLPLWDAGGNRYYAGCFIWSESAVPVFTVDSEIAYISAFTNSLMVEISRLDALTSNKMKSDFISSISHEFRSPLHGILASAEFLRESQLNASQMEFISTIQNCSGTLLDTINHVLDYSKINSFERAGHHQDTISNELYQDTNVALLCEDIVNGMIAANEFHGTGSTNPSLSNSTDLLSRSHDRPHRIFQKPPLEVIVDIEKRDWDFKVQPGMFLGALRRVVMNIFGNAQKYTELGYIMVQLKIKESQPPGSESGNAAGCLSLHIRDTGKGMSSEYMQRKLYHPFAQEDSFAPGVGLGLSIVWSIVNQLGGKISIRSELGKGTDVEVIIPVEKADHSKYLDTGFGNSTSETNNPEECIMNLRRKAAGKSIFVRRGEEATGASRHKDISWSCIQSYCSDWFGFEVKQTLADLMITNRHDFVNYADEQRILVIHDDVGYSTKQDDIHHRKAIGHISSPVGPFRLARSLLALLDQEISLPHDGNKITVNQIDAGTQTPLGSPEERTMMNGIILTDYGFTPQPSLASILDRPSNDEPEIASASNATSITRNAQRQQVGHQAFASINALSLPQLPAPTSPSTECTSHAFPHFSSPIMELKLPHNPKIVQPPTDLSAHSTSTSLHILAVDDNALNLQLLHRYLLKRRSDTIVTARNGVEAVEAVREGKGFDVVFMDISMPEMDGFEATRIIRGIEQSRIRQVDSNKGIKTINGENQVQVEEMRTNEGEVAKNLAYIVALTGLASRRDRDMAQEIGFDDFLTKPISFARIGELLKRLSEEKGRPGKFTYAVP